MRTAGLLCAWILLGQSLVHAQCDENWNVFGLGQPLKQVPLTHLDVEIPTEPLSVSPTDVIPQVLAKKVKLKLEKAPLQKFAELLEDQLGTEVVFDEDALSDEGIRLDLPVSEFAENEPAHYVIRRVFENLYLFAIVEQDKIIITTQLALEYRGYTKKEYDISALVESGYRVECLKRIVQTGTRWWWKDDVEEGGTIDVKGSKLMIDFHQPAQVEVQALLKALEKPGRQTFVMQSEEIVQRYQKLFSKRITINSAKLPRFKAIDQLAQHFGPATRFGPEVFRGNGRLLTGLISIKAWNEPFEDFLEQLANENITIVPRDNQLYVASKLAADEEYVTAVYNVADIAATMDQTESLNRFIFNFTKGPWDNVHGVGGTVIIPRKSVLVIRCTMFTHQKIRFILDELRSVLPIVETE